MPKGILIVAKPKSDGPPPLGPLDGSSDPDADPGQEPDGADDTAQQSCADCKFYETDNGYCLRYPPDTQGWPVVQPDEWCGEYAQGVPHKKAEAPQPDDSQPPSGDTPGAPRQMTGS